MLAFMQSLFERVDEPRFADPCLSRHEHRLALAALDEFPALEQHPNFAASADKFRQRTGVCGFETAFHLTFAANRKQGDR